MKRVVLVFCVVACILWMWITTEAKARNLTIGEFYPVEPYEGKVPNCFYSPNGRIEISVGATENEARKKTSSWSAKTSVLVKFQHNYMGQIIYYWVYIKTDQQLERWVDFRKVSKKEMRRLNIGITLELCPHEKLYELRNQLSLMLIEKIEESEPALHLLGGMLKNVVEKGEPISIVPTVTNDMGQFKWGWKVYYRPTPKTRGITMARGLP